MAFRAAAPFRLIVPLPLGARMTYVAKRSALFTL